MWQPKNLSYIKSKSTTTVQIFIKSPVRSFRFLFKVQLDHSDFDQKSNTTLAGFAVPGQKVILY